jgi:hypothetical protein
VSGVVPLPIPPPPCPTPGQVYTGNREASLGQVEAVCCPRPGPAGPASPTSTTGKPWAVGVQLAFVRGVAGPGALTRDTAVAAAGAGGSSAGGASGGGLAAAGSPQGAATPVTASRLSGPTTFDITVFAPCRLVNALPVSTACFGVPMAAPLVRMFRLVLVHVLCAHVCLNGLSSGLLLLLQFAGASAMPGTGLGSHPWALFLWLPRGATGHRCSARVHPGTSPASGRTRATSPTSSGCCCTLPPRPPAPHTPPKPSIAFAAHCTVASRSII